MSTTKKKLWPVGKPIPNFKSLREEEQFWQSHTFEDGPSEDWQELKSTRVSRDHVYRVRLNDVEMSKLKTLAKRRGVAASVVLRDLVRKAAA